MVSTSRGTKCPHRSKCGSLGQLLKRNGSRTQGTSLCTPTSRPTPVAGVAPGERNSALRDQILARLKQGWRAGGRGGPGDGQAGHLPRDHLPVHIRAEEGLHLGQYLVETWAGVVGEGTQPHSALRRPLAGPQEAKQTPGHWEASDAVQDLTGRPDPPRAPLPPDHRSQAASDPIAEAMTTVLAAEWRQTVTFDNGTEFARHHQLHALGIQTFFCDTHSPWQKGGVENAIGCVAPCPGTDLADISDDRFTQLVQAYNNTPRKCLEYRTPVEIFLNHVLHLKCESTFPFARE